MKQKEFEAVALVNRMVAYYQRKGISTEQALQQARNRLGGSYLSAIETVQMVLLPDQQTLSGRPKSANAILSSLRKDTQQGGGDQNTLLSIAHQVLNKVSPGIKACARFFSSLYLYPCIIVVISLVVYFMYKLFVFPQMSGLNSMQALPEFTMTVFSDLTSSVVVVVSAVCALWLIWQVAYLRRCFANVQVMNSMLGKITGIDQHHTYLIFLAYLSILLKAGVAPSIAVEKAKAYTGLDEISGSHYQHHRAALSLLQTEQREIFEDEVEFQFNDVLQGIEQALISQQEKLLITFQMAIFVFVGAMIIAMYLPIFQLASVF